MPFRKGHPRIPGSGRKKDVRNKLTLEARELAQSLLTEEYRERLKARLLEGKAGIIEAKVWEYAFGKPVDMVRVSGTINLPSVIHHRYTEGSSAA